MPVTSASPSSVAPGEVYDELERRLGRLHARQRLGIERDHEARVYGEGIKFFHLENWYSARSLIRNSLRLVGLYSRGQRNALSLKVVHNRISMPRLPEAFQGFRILHISDPHVDVGPAVVEAIQRCVEGVEYDLCVLTGDYRASTRGSIEPALAGMLQFRKCLTGDIYAVLGNHDSIRMLPGLEAAGIRLLLNESVTLERNRSRLHLAGIDDAHYYRVDNIEKAAADFSQEECSILLSHTPEVYRQAAHAEFDLFLCGHTHGGQICLPGGRPVLLDARIPRHLGRGSWRHHDMLGYTSPGAGTSIVPVRLNCPGEVTLHTLTKTEESFLEHKAVEH